MVGPDTVPKFRHTVRVRHIIKVSPGCFPSFAKVSKFLWMIRYRVFYPPQITICTVQSDRQKIIFVVVSYCGQIAFQARRRSQNYYLLLHLC